MPRRIFREIGAVIVGYVSAGLLIVLTDQIWRRADPTFRYMYIAWKPYFAVSLVTDAFYSAVGGYICAWIAREPSRQAVFGLMALGEIISVATTIWLWGYTPHWFAVGLLLIYPPAVWFGSRLRSKR